MTNQQGGDQPAAVVIDLGSMETPASNTEKPHASAIPTKEEPKEGGVLPKAETDPSQEPAKSDPNHKLVIDLIEDKFGQLKDGRMEDQELREWFDSHPEIADKANRSKRVKDQYRSLMERSPEVRRGERKVETPEADDDDPKIKKGEPMPLTKDDLERILEERDSRLIERTLKVDRTAKAEKFASERGIVDDEYTTFQETAEALYKVNPKLNWDQAMEAALRGIFPEKGKGVSVSASGRQEQPKGEVQEDATKGIVLADKDEFFGRKK